MVARCGEDLAWTRNIPPGVRLAVYDKTPGGGAWPGSVALPNVGREAHTHLHHLAERYDSLSAVTVFCQGKPFDHAHDLHGTLRELAAGRLVVADFLWLGFIIDTDDRRGRRLFVSWSKNPERRELDMDALHAGVFGGPGPEWYAFRPGGQFAVARACARGRAREFYAKARELSAALPDAAHGFERMWDRVFGVAPMERAAVAPAGTAYCKRIRRLEACVRGKSGANWDADVTQPECHGRPGV